MTGPVSRQRQQAVASYPLVQASLPATGHYRVLEPDQCQVHIPHTPLTPLLVNTAATVSTKAGNEGPQSFHNPRKDPISNGLLLVESS